SERGNEKREHIDAVVKVLAELALLNPIVKVAMGGRDGAHIDGNRIISADPLDFTLFENAQEFRLHGERHVANLVQEKRAALCLLELSQVAAGGAGERSFFMAKEFRLNQLCRDGRAIKRDEWTGAARAALVQSAGDQFFAGARFTKNRDSCFAGRDTIDLCHQAAHGFALPDNLVLAESREQLLVFLLHPP